VAVVAMLFHAYAGVGFITYCYLEFRATRIELASLNAPQADVKEVLGEIVYASGRNTVLLASVAAFEFLGFMIDQIKHRQEAAESARLRDELDATMRIADDFALQMGPWRISERSGTAIKKKLSIPDYQGQKFVIYREYENIDGEGERNFNIRDTRTSENDTPAHGGRGEKDSHRIRYRIVTPNNLQVHSSMTAR
jgi:hypothetical protein